MHPAPRRRAGLSLLEVLVACGILAIGLGSVAALLPAAGARLGQATQEDRAGVAAANAYAEMVSRGLVVADVFSVFSGTTKACLFGQVATAITSNTANTAWLVSSATASAEWGRRIDAVRGILLEDDLNYPASADTPLNRFMISGSGGPREFAQSVCWGGMLTPLVSPTASGSAAATSLAGLRGMRATMSLAVFKKPGIAQELRLVPVAGSGLTRIQAVSGTAVPEVDRRRYLTGCSYVLALPLNAATTWPAWVQVTSSWTVSGTSFCALSWNELDSTRYVATGGTATVLGFENLMRVDRYQVTLD